ncbi:MAG: FtsX-like permease family protein [Sphaerochaeta sp.]
MSTPLIHMLVTRKLGIQGTWASKKRILFNVLLISIVVGALVFAQMFVVSMSNGIANKYALLGNGHIQIHENQETEITVGEYISDMQFVAQAFALVYSPTKNQMVRLKGVGPTYFNEQRLGELTLLDTELVSDGSTLPQVLISTSLANLLCVGQGDRIALMMINNNTLRPQLVIIKNLYDSGYKELDEQLVFCDYSLMERLFSNKADTYYELLVDDDKIETVKSSLQSQGLSVTSWDEENYSVATNLNTSKQAVLGVMLVVAVLCGYFISELSREMIEDDKHKIAMLKLLGAKDSLIRRVYFTTVMLVTVLSVVLGTSIGIFMGMNLGNLLSLLAKQSIPALSFYLLDFVIVIPYMEIALILLVLLIVGALSILWSLRRVHKIDLLSCTHFD